MKRNLFIVIIIIFVLVVLSRIFLWNGNEKIKNQFIFAKIERGNLENTVSSTGTINPVKTVNIGTQVSGEISHLYADFNDKVYKGKLLAVLDTTVLKASVINAEAGVQRQKAQLKLAEDSYQRDLRLFKKGLISDADFLPVKTNLETQRAALISAETNLKSAKRNLNYAYIRSPINGTVIERTVEEGQTEAARFNAPTLFVVAEDLSKMQIHALVDESDIGQIRVGQKARFTVEAYPDKVFLGTVKQIRLQPQTIQNVVNYTVIVDAPNKDKLLLPGMTATIDFIIQQRKNALLVPNTALQFRPTQQMLLSFQKNREKRLSNLPDSVRAKIKSRMKNPHRFAESRGGNSFGLNSNRNHSARIWFLDPKGNLGMEQIKIGATDGIKTEIIRGRHIREGMTVITGFTNNALKSAKSSPRFRRRPLF